MSEVNPKFQQYEKTIEKLHADFSIERKKYERIIEGNI